MKNVRQNNSNDALPVAGAQTAVGDFCGLSSLRAMVEDHHFVCEQAGLQVLISELLHRGSVEGFNRSRPLTVGLSDTITRSNELCEVYFG